MNGQVEYYYSPTGGFDRLSGTATATAGTGRRTPSDCRMEAPEIGHVNERDESVSEQQRTVSDSQSANDRGDPYGGRSSPKWDQWRCHSGGDRLVIKEHQMTARSNVNRWTSLSTERSSDHAPSMARHTDKRFPLELATDSPTWTRAHQARNMTVQLDGSFQANTATRAVDSEMDKTSFL